METGQFATDISLLEDQAPLDTTNQTTAAPSSEATPADTTVETTEAPAQGEGGSNEEELTVIDQLKAMYQVEDELPNEIEGIQKLVDKVGATKAEALLKEKFDKYPVMGELEKHLSEGKSIESFFNVKQVETSKLPLHKLTGDDKKDAELKTYYKDVIKADALEKGMSDNQIKRLIEAGDLEGTLFEDYEESVKSWNARRDNEAKNITQAEEAQRLADIESEKEIITKINTIIDAGTIGEAIIPVAERAEFKKFQLEQDTKGFTARDKAIAALPLEKNLLIDYLIYKDFKIKGLQFAPSRIQTLATLNKGRLGTLNGGGEGNGAEQQRLPAGILESLSGLK